MQLTHIMSGIASFPYLAKRWRINIHTSLLERPYRTSCGPSSFSGYLSDFDDRWILQTAAYH